MFNFLKKQQQTEANYPEIVTKIHREFDTASERILAEAKQIIENCNVSATEKVKTLERLGFKKAQQVKETNDALRQKEKAEETARHVVYYREKYPFNKFITEAEVEKICKKYGLVKGGVDLFTGFVPEVKLQEIERFKVMDEDREMEFKYGSSWFSLEELKRPWMWGEGGKYKDDPADTIKYDACIKAGKPVNNSCRYAGSTLQICAPKNQMNMESKRLSLDGYTLVDKDPIVLQPVKGGYLIVTAWGDEASDPIVVNPVNN